MQRISAEFTVFFEEPFWVGVYQRREGGKLSVCRIVFGAEPTEQEVYAFLLANEAFMRFSPAISGGCAPTMARNPKRRARQAAKSVAKEGIGTRAQQALKQQYEEDKTARKQRSKQQREAEADRKYELRQEKKKEKHKGH